MYRAVCMLPLLSASNAIRFYGTRRIEYERREYQESDTISTVSARLIQDAFTNELNSQIIYSQGLQNSDTRKIES